MSKFLTTLLLLLCLTGAWAQTDSLTIKLQQYKTLFEKGLINTTEYEALKAKALQLNTPDETEQQMAEEPDTTPAKKERFNASVVPVFYSDAAQIFNSSGFNTTTKMRGTASLGFHVLAGPSFKKRFHPNLGVGVEVWKDKLRVPVYFDFGMKMLKTRFSPYYHVSLGYMYMRGNSTGSPAYKRNALLAGAGIGFNVYTVKHFAVGLCLDYRFLYNPVAQPTYNPLLPTNEGPPPLTAPNYIHQAGLRLLLTCY